jgi:UDP-N-acetylglucosamine 2-epimerase (non-hydrolysing)
VSVKRIAVVYGTRPEAIKVAPLISALSASDTLQPLIVVTGQHREMLDQVNDLFGIRPHHDLDLMVPGATLAEISSRALTGVSGVLAAEKPDALVVQGDTSTAFIAALHLAPTQVSRRNLLGEGIDDAAIAVIGNTVIDALYDAVRVPTSFDDPGLGALVASGQRFVLVTAHRRESWGDPMREAMQGLADTAAAHPDVRWVVPMHRNPIVREVIEDVLGGVESVLLTEPLEYHQFTHVMRAAHLLLTDSGGVQEEAPSLGKPVLVMRDTTERPEAVDAGTVRLVGTSRRVIATELARLLDDAAAYNLMANAVNPYGDGRAAPRARAAIEHMLGLGDRLPDFAPTPKGTVNV